MLNVLLSAIVLTYGTVAVISDDFYIPGRSLGGTHFHGEPAWILYGAVLCAVGNWTSVVIDHYDRRNNAKNYRLFARISQLSAWTLLILAFLMELLVCDKATK